MFPPGERDMTTLVVVPKDVAAVIEGQGLNFDLFKDTNSMLKYLSAADVADIVIASNDFPFDYGSMFTIDMEQKLHEYMQTNELADKARRIQSRIETAQLKFAAEVDHFVSSYQLYCVDEKLWVAVQQRQHIGDSDPKRLLLKVNSAFFDALLAQALHTTSFEKVCATNLFNDYLSSL
jgi:hypothetical protein